MESPWSVIFFLLAFVFLLEYGLYEKEKRSFSCAKPRKGIQMNSLEDLSFDFNSLLEPWASRYSDVTLKCTGISIPAHKNILSARSPIFASMFDNPMDEVEITDLDASILEKMLEYIYSGDILYMTASLAEDLLFAAHKYQLPGLKRLCSSVLMKNVNIQNVLRILILGDSYCEDLRSFAVSYICSNNAEFSVLEEQHEWKNLQKERPDLAFHVLTSVINSRKQDIKIKIVKGSAKSMFTS